MKMIRKAIADYLTTQDKGQEIVELVDTQDIIEDSETKESKTYAVNADITPFYDIWGDNHTRTIKITNWFIFAYIAVLIHVLKYPNGSAVISNIN